MEKYILHIQNYSKLLDWRKIGQLACSWQELLISIWWPLYPHYFAPHSLHSLKNSWYIPKKLYQLVLLQLEKQTNNATHEVIQPWHSIKILDNPENIRILKRFPLCTSAGRGIVSTSVTTRGFAKPSQSQVDLLISSFSFLLF